jgi:hypothetical protein
MRSSPSLGGHKAEEELPEARPGTGIDGWQRPLRHFKFKQGTKAAGWVTTGSVIFPGPQNREVGGQSSVSKEAGMWLSLWRKPPGPSASDQGTVKKLARLTAIRIPSARDLDGHFVRCSTGGDLTVA